MKKLIFVLKATSGFCTTDIEEIKSENTVENYVKHAKRYYLGKNVLFCQYQKIYLIIHNIL